MVEIWAVVSQYAQNEHSLEINRRDATKTEVKEWPILSLPPAADRIVSINLEHLGLAVGARRDPLFGYSRLLRSNDRSRE